MRFPSNKNNARLFIAVPIPEQNRGPLENVQSQLKAKTDLFSWTRMENVHVTLLFLGDTSASQLPQLTEVIRNATQEIAPFTIVFGAFGAFVQLQSARVLFIHVQSPEQRLFQLQRALSAHVAPMGQFDLDKRTYHPHITLARIRKKTKAVDARLYEIQTPAPHSMMVNSITLFESHVQGGVLRYLPVEEFSLNNGPPSGQS